ncbi:MAG: HD domain-containing protein [Phycisphaerae bacterium]|jgi:3'-5' exoribonuclease
MAHLFIDQIQAGQQINDVYLISQAVLRSTTNGKLYIAMFVADKTGKTNGRVWNATEELFKSLPKEGFVQIIGRSELYQNTLQIVADKIASVPSEKINIDDYLPRTPKDIKQMYEETVKILGEIKNPSVKALVDEFIKDKELMKKFCKAPAAMSNHHSYLGGLLEHTHNMLKSAKAILPCYPQLQADLVLAGIFLHDMGKTEELSYEMAFGYTDKGQLIGHIVQTTLMVDQKADAIEISQTILDSIMHIILSHHGEYEFGSPKLPMTAEAYLVNFLDNIDAKMNQIAEKIETDPSQDNWTGFIKALDSKLYRKRVVD